MLLSGVGIRGFRATGERGTYQKSLGSWDLRFSLPKTEKSADLAHYFSGVAKFCVPAYKKIKHRT